MSDVTYWGTLGEAGPPKVCPNPPGTHCCACGGAHSFPPCALGCPTRQPELRVGKAREG